MASYILTDEEVKSILQQAEMYIEMEPSWRDWAPIKEIPDGYKHEYYILERVPRAADSHDGRDFSTVQTARQSSTVNITSKRYAFSIPRVTVEMARQKGIPIWSDNIAVALKHLDMQISHLILEGNNASFDKVTINGLRDGGTENANDATVWNTAPGPTTHLAAGWGALNTAGWTGPFTWVLSSNLAPGLKTKYGAGDPSQEKMVDAYDIDKIVYLPIGTTTELQTYPIAPADADDGAWFMFPTKSTQAWYVGEVFAPKVTINPELNQKLNAYEGWIEWRGTVAILQATGVQYDPDVDLA